MVGGGRLRLTLVYAAALPAALIAPPPTKLNVRFATSDDFKAIASLRTSIFSSHLTSLYSKIEQDRLFVDTMSKKSAVVAAVRPTDGAYLGCADVGREELPGRGVTACYVTSVCVHPDARRTGLARRMMSLAEAHAATVGATAIFLHVEDANEAAVGLYEALGFAPVADGGLVEYFSAPRYVDPDALPQTLLTLPVEPEKPRRARRAARGGFG